jgi:NADPH:quinone reductase-like Zn-dependent oxidoreductase/NAD(P)-dependent dehydrogenase (short-subunit alcohol dehydrogenase family)
LYGFTRWASTPNAHISTSTHRHRSSNLTPRQLLACRASTVAARLSYGSFVRSIGSVATCNHQVNTNYTVSPSIVAADSSALHIVLVRPQITAHWTCHIIDLLRPQSSAPSIFRPLGRTLPPRPQCRTFRITIQRFDLIIASNVLSTVNDIQACLKNLHRLLRRNGRLLLEEPHPGLLWAKFVLGTLPQWWRHADDTSRKDDPFIDKTRLRDLLQSAGFPQIDHVEPSSCQQSSSVLVARPHAAKVPVERVTLLVRDCNVTEPSHIFSELESQGYAIDRRELGQALPPGQDVIALLEEEHPFFGNIDETRLAQIKSLAHELDDKGLLWVTRPSSMGCSNPAYAQIVGLARTIRSETASDFATLQADKIQSSEVASAVVKVMRTFQARDSDGELAPDLEYTIHDTRTYVSRIFPFSLDKELLVSQPANEAVVTQHHPGRLNTLVWSSASATPPKDDEIEISIYAAGLNFRDVLVGMQIIPGERPTFGYEAAGIVRRVGPKVSKFVVGDRVVGIGSDLFSTTTTNSEVCWERLPDNLSFNEGASLPLVFVTALYALRDVGRLSKGQSVLIHSGAGGVGLAAIQVSQMLGVEVFTTVGSERKVKYLMETYGIPRNRIFNSRDASFAKGVLCETHGRGVDVVLNSLAGELLHASWKCVAEWGTMVEIGKRDLLGNARLEMAPFLGNRNYCCFDTNRMEIQRPELLEQLLSSIMSGFTLGQFKPFRVDQVFPASGVLDAMRYMQQGKHIGKIVIEIHNPEGHRMLDEVNTTKNIGAGLNGDASYLLIGGLGGLGRSMSVWMAQNGARHLTYLSRSAGSGAHDADLVTELRSMGCTVQLLQGDVANPDDVARVVNGTVAPLRGVIQMSMVLRDQMFDGMSIEDWNAVTRPKIQGTWNLHNSTLASGCDLDFFLLFSSISGIVGQVGQANYASANAFLDAFVQYRKCQNLPCTAIDLGAVEGIGYLAQNQELLKKMQGTGWSVVHEAELLAALPLAFMSPTTRSQRGQNANMADTFLLGLSPTVPLSSPNSSARLKRDPRLAVYHNIGGSNIKDTSSAATTLNTLLSSIKKDPNTLRSPDTVEQLALEIGRKICSLTLTDDTDVRSSVSVADLGLDSLVAVEMRGWWKLAFSFDITTLDLLSLGTLQALGKRVADELIVKYNA